MHRQPSSFRDLGHAWGALPTISAQMPSGVTNGTILALTGTEIIMGPCSELGPADPHIQIAPNNAVPAHFLLAAGQNVDPIFVQAATHAIVQTSKLAHTLLSSGMMKGQSVRGS